MVGFLKLLYFTGKWRKYGTVTSFVLPAICDWTVDLFGLDTVCEAFVTHSNVFSDRPQISRHGLTKPGEVVKFSYVIKYEILIEVPNIELHASLLFLHACTCTHLLVV